MSNSDPMLPHVQRAVNILQEQRAAAEMLRDLKVEMKSLHIEKGEIAAVIMAAKDQMLDAEKAARKRAIRERADDLLGQGSLFSK